MESPAREFPPDRVENVSYAAAMRGLASKDFLKSQVYQKQQWRALRTGAHPVILEFSEAFVKRCSKLNIPVFAHNMVRTWEEQDKLLADGVSRAGGGHSAHNFGMAVDLVHSVKLWGLTRKEWDVLGHLGREVAKARGLEVDWGGDWSSLWDPAHWQVTGWKRLVADYPFTALPPPVGD